MRDVTDKMVTEHRYSSVKPPSFRSIRPAPTGKPTPNRERVLGLCHGLRLGFISRPLFYDDVFYKGAGRWSTRDHKTLLELLYGGHLKVFQMPGDLPGEHPLSSVGTKAGQHYLLTDARKPWGIE